MRPSQRALIWLACSLAYACGDGSEGLSGDGSGLTAAEQTATDAPPEDVEYNDSDPVAGDANGDGELTVEDLECPRGGSVGKIRVSFDCGEITVVSCKDLSNVVLELADGTRERFEGLKGQHDVFSAKSGAEIVGVWVKAGSNHSGDGPGYGERFDAPAGTCDPDQQCAPGDTSCTPPPPPPPREDDCFVADGSCEPWQPPPPPPREDDCFVADGSCDPWTPPPPPPPAPEEPMAI